MSRGLQKTALTTNEENSARRNSETQVNTCQISPCEKMPTKTLKTYIPLQKRKGIKYLHAGGQGSSKVAILMATTWITKSNKGTNTEPQVW